MSQLDVSAIIQQSRQEMLFAIKERLNEISEGPGMPVLPPRVVIGGGRLCGDGVSFFELTNLYVDEGGTLCGDLLPKGERLGHAVLFGRGLENLPIEDLKLILDSLYAKEWNVVPPSPSSHVRRTRGGLFGLFSSRRPAVRRGC